MIAIRNKVSSLDAERLRLVSITCARSGSGNTIYYHFSYDNKPELSEVSVEIPQGEDVESIIDLFKNAALFEAEITELFGIKFIGNEYSGKRLFQPENRGKKCTPPFSQ